MPSLIGFSMALFAMVIGAIDAPNPRQLLLTFIIVIATLVLNTFALWEIGTPLNRLLDAVRGLNHKRMEVRADGTESGITGELAQQINLMAARLLQEQDQVDSMVTQSAARLRRDHQELLEQHQELRRSLAAALKAVESQSELFSNLSHELRTPLTAILGYTDLLIRSRLDAEQQAHLTTVNKSAQGMLGMINDLLDWGRIEAGRLSLNDDQVDILQIVEDVAEMLSTLAYEKGLELVRIVYQDVPKLVRGDAQRLRQIVTNLLSNAIKFTERGEVVLRVMRDRSDEGRAWLNFSVSDTGPGISPEQQRRLFHAFQQTKGTQGGSGLGLTITRRLTELMGGRVDMQSTLGQGSTFGAVIPFRLVEVKDTQPNEYAPLRGLELWVMEPHPVVRLGLIHWLEHWQCTVRSFDTVPLLYTALDQNKPAAIILGLRTEDIQHPDYAALLQRCASRQPPLLALVTSVSPEVQGELRRSGAASVLSKAVGHHTLQESLISLLARTRSPQQPLSGLRALVADNNLLNRRYIVTLCQELGMQVAEAADGVEALDYWHRQRPDVVLLDARMPEMDGLDCARVIREEDPERRSCVIAISANLEPAERRAFTMAGVDGLLIKPFDSRALLRLLEPRSQAVLPPSKQLTSDPQLLELLREELPLQLGELEDSLSRAEIVSARDAIHQLHGTAAFYHIDTLKKCTSALEQSLLRIETLEDDKQWKPLMLELQKNLRQVLQTL